MDGISRRGALAATAAAIGVKSAQAATTNAATTSAATDHAAQNEPVKIRFCCRLYDRMLPLYTGAVKIPGVQIEFLPNGDHRAVFDAMENHLAFDVSELSFSDFITFTSLKPDYPIVAVPVFSSRVFRHSSIYVNRTSGITDVKQFEGKPVGIPRWGESAVIWARGMLQDEYGLDLSKVQWVTGEMNQAGVHGEVAETARFREFSIEANKTGKSLSQLLEAGELACVMGATTPVAFGKNPDVVRMFPDFRAREKDWYRRTRHYPIMHVIAMRRDVHDANPWLAARLVEACQTAKRQALRDMGFTGSLLYMLPWLPDDLAEVHSVFGDDPWPYGIEENRPSIEAEIRYMVEQGVIPHARKAEDLFVPV